VHFVTEPRYWPYYCEENVWHLCGDATAKGREAWAMVVSNRSRQVAVWQQRAASPGRPVVWDYHVVLLAHEDGGFTVQDPDSLVGSPVAAGRWLDASFKDAPDDAGGLAPLFRIVPATVFRSELRSDRCHMRNGNGWLEPPPPWPPIGTGSNLMRFVDTENDFLGEVVDLASLRARINGEVDWPR
jgi:hypothetical protein